MTTALILLGMFAGLFLIVCIVDRLHDRWVWRSAIRETNAQFGLPRDYDPFRDGLQIPPPGRFVQEDGSFEPHHVAPAAISGHWQIGGPKALALAPRKRPRWITRVLCKAIFEFEWIDGPPK
jgi:hypothetical protein